MSLPLIIAAKFLNIKIYLIEPNQVLGRANRFFLKSCKKIFCHTKEVKNFPEKFRDKIVIINSLVKQKIYDLNSNSKKKDIFTILVVGGSQGASFFDKKLKDIIINISKKNLIKILHQTNEKNISFLNNFYLKNKINNKVFSFDKNFDQIIHQADLCITRAGAATLAELSVLNIPFIAIPLPTSKDNHQFENADYFRRNGCCWLVEQMSFEKEIEHILKKILNNKNELFEKKENLKKLNYQNSWINVNQKILNILNEN